MLNRSTCIPRLSLPGPEYTNRLCNFFLHSPSTGPALPVPEAILASYPVTPLLGEAKSRNEAFHPLHGSCIYAHDVAPEAPHSHTSLWPHSSLIPTHWLGVLDWPQICLITGGFSSSGWPSLLMLDQSLPSPWSQPLLPAPSSPSSEENPSLPARPDCAFKSMESGLDKEYCGAGMIPIINPLHGETRVRATWILFSLSFLFRALERAKYIKKRFQTHLQFYTTAKIPNTSFTRLPVPTRLFVEFYIPYLKEIKKCNQISTWWSVHDCLSNFTCSFSQSEH